MNHERVLDVSNYWKPFAFNCVDCSVGRNCVLRPKGYQMITDILSIFGYAKMVVFGGASIAWNDTLQSRFDAILPVLRSTIPDDTDRALVAGVMWTESAFDPNAINGCRPPYTNCIAATGIANGGSGAQGLMQLMPFHNATFGWNATTFRDPRKNILAGMQILKDQGLGRKEIGKVLAGYGGFVTVNPDEYVNKVLARSTYMQWKV